MPVRSPPSGATCPPLDTLFRQILTPAVHARWRSCFERHGAPDESPIAFLERLEATDSVSLSILKLVAKEFIVLEAARPLLARAKFAAGFDGFLERLDPGGSADASPSTTNISVAVPASPVAEAGPLRTYRRSWAEEDYEAMPDSDRLDTLPPTPPAYACEDEANSGECDALPPVHLDSSVHIESSVQPTKRLGPAGAPPSARAVGGPHTAGGGHVLSPGTRLGKYVVESLIGQGSFGMVYSSMHPSLRIPVAIKVMRSTLGTGADRERFVSEARLVAQLNHPAIVRVWDFDDTDGVPYLVMEYVDGATLADLIREQGKLPAAAALGIVRRVAEGLQEASRLGIVHQDIKPANILIARSGTVKLTDFGVAVLQDVALGEMLSIRVDADCICGTAFYMPPEQAEGDDVDARADMYALGVTLYQAITGQLPFVGKTTTHVLLKKLKSNPTPPGDLVPGLPKAVSAFVLKLISRRRTDRFANYAELLTALAGAESAARAAVPSVPTWSADAQAAAGPPPADGEQSGSIWNWFIRSARRLMVR